MNLKVISKIHFLMICSFLLTGCWWQEQACNISLGPEDTGKVFHYDECKAINDPATRGWLLNKR